MSLSSVQEFIKYLENHKTYLPYHYRCAPYKHDLDNNSSQHVLLKICYKIRIRKNANRALWNM